MDAKTARTVTLAGAGVVSVSAFLPWASFLGFTKYGIEGDGRVTLVIAAIGGSHHGYVSGPRGQPGLEHEPLEQLVAPRRWRETTQVRYKRARRFDALQRRR